MFLPTFSTVFSAIFQLFLISAAAGLLVREKIVSQTHIKALPAVTVNIFLPCLIVVKTVSQFDPSKFAQWWLLPLSGVLIALTGLDLAFLLFGPGPEKRAYISLASFQNAIYIVLPIGQLVFPNQFDQLALYCFLLILGQSPIMWSVGKVLISGEWETGIRWQAFFHPAADGGPGGHLDFFYMKYYVNLWIISSFVAGRLRPEYGLPMAVV